jgi:hypothetical protein
MQRTNTGLFIGLLAVGAAYGQSPPVKPHLIMWPGSNDVSNGSVTPSPSSAIPITRDDWNALWTDPDNDQVRSATQAADRTFYDISPGGTSLVTDAEGGWIDHDHITIFPRYFGIDLFVNDAPSPAPIDPRTDSRTARGARWPYEWSFFYPNDRLIGLSDDYVNGDQPRFPTGEDSLHYVQDSDPALFYYEIGASNRSYRHPFLLNATQASRLRAYTVEYAAALNANLHSAQAASVGIHGAQPTFIFDAEQAHIVQRPDKHSCIYMLWFLTQARVPGASPTSTDENDFIWNRFKVPGSEGWWPPTRSEIYDNAPIAAPDTGFATTTGQTLAQLYREEVQRQNPPQERRTWPASPTEEQQKVQYWPSNPSDPAAERANLVAMMNLYASSPSVLPDHPAVRGIMLWWMEVCAKAEGAIWENAVFGPLHEEFPNSTFINYTQMTTDGKVDTSSTVHDLGVLPTPAWPDDNWLYPYPQGASEPEYPARATGGLAPLTSELPRAVWSAAGANAQWRDGGPIAADGTQRRVNFFPQHIQGQIGSVAQQVMDSPDLYWRGNSAKHFFPDCTLDTNPCGAHGRNYRMEDPSLPSWAQLSPEVQAEPIAFTPEWFRWNQHMIFQNMLEYRHVVESTINSGHIEHDPNGEAPYYAAVRLGQRQDGLVPWIFQQHPDQIDPPMTPAEIDAYWVKVWGERTRTLMAMLRGKDSHEALGEPRRQWAVFMNGTADFGWDVLWNRSVKQRDQVYTSLVTDYRSITGVCPTCDPSSGAYDPHRLNDTLRRGSGQEQYEHVVENTADSSVAPVPGYSGQITRTEVEVTLHPYDWVNLCHRRTFAGEGQAPEVLTRGVNPQLGGAYEVWVETTSEVDRQVTGGEPSGMPLDPLNMAVQAYQWPSLPDEPDRAPAWCLLPLEVLSTESQPVWAAPVRDYLSQPDTPQVPRTQTVRVRRKYVLREPTVTLGPDGSIGVGAQFTTPIRDTTNNSIIGSLMKLRVIQSCPVASAISTSIDLVQVVPVCAYDLYTGSVDAPRQVPALDPSDPTAAEDAAAVDYASGHNGMMPPGFLDPILRPLGSLSDQAFADYLDAIADPGWAAPANPRAVYVDTDNPGPAFLSSAFCQVTPSVQGAFEPAALVIELPTWVRSDMMFNAAPETYVQPVCIRLVDSTLDPGGTHYTEASDCGASVYNYAQAMMVGVRHVEDGWRSSSIVLHGVDAALLTEGTYEVTPILSAGGLVQDSNVSPSEPAMDFAVRFTLLSDCNANGVPDYLEVVEEPITGNWVDAWPMDGLIDACHPELCEPDYNGDGLVNQGDVDTLAACINGDCSQMAPHADPDFNRDGNADQDDVSALVNTVAGGGCP